jgi:hypothetical protein
MRKGNIGVLVFVFLLQMFVIQSSTFAIDRQDVSTLECSGGIVNVGDSRFEVLEKCGEPTKKEGSQEYLWIYDFGSSRFVYYLTFTGDRLDRIQTGDYGEEEFK